MNLSDYLSNRKQLKQEVRPQLINIQEEFWYGEFLIMQICPHCEIEHNMLITFTKASVKISCQQEKCKKKFFYRRVNLGVIE